jgi:hypothetical protein
MVEIDALTIKYSLFGIRTKRKTNIWKNAYLFVQKLYFHFYNDSKFEVLTFLSKKASSSKMHQKINLTTSRVTKLTGIPRTVFGFEPFQARYT